MKLTPGFWFVRGNHVFIIDDNVYETAKVHSEEFVMYDFFFKLTYIFMLSARNMREK